MSKDYIPETIGWGGSNSMSSRVSCLVVAGNLLSPAHQAPTSDAAPQELVENAFENSGTLVSGFDEGSDFHALKGASVFEATAVDSGTGDYIRTPSGTDGVSVNAGDTYFGEGTFAHAANTGTVTLDIKWYDSAGTLLSTDTLDSASTSTTGKALSGSATAPSNAEHAALEFTSDAADDLMFSGLAIRPNDDRIIIVKTIHVTAASNIIHFKRIWNDGAPPESAPMGISEVPNLELSGGSTVEPNMVLENGDYLLHDNNANANNYSYITGIVVIP